MTYTPEQRAADEEIALAMGWCEVPPINYLADTQWYHKGTYHKHPPRFHESHDARAALLEWLAADEGRWGRFYSAFREMNPFKEYKGLFNFEDAVIRRAFLATPAQVAEAALRAIREGE